MLKRCSGLCQQDPYLAHISCVATARAWPKESTGILGKHSHSPTWLYEGWGRRDLKTEEGEQQASNRKMQGPWGRMEVFPALLSNHVPGTPNKHANITMRRAVSTAQRNTEENVLHLTLSKSLGPPAANLYLKQRADTQLHAGRT